MAEEKSKLFPIVYNELYNVRLFGFENLHPFDALKWKHIFDYLKEASLIDYDTINIPDEATDNELLSVHTKRYINSLKWSYTVAKIAEVFIIAFIPNSLVQKYYLKSMRYQVNGSILAGKIAVDGGCAVNIGGGFHHCSKDSGGGFCPYADITLLIKYLFQNFPSKVKTAMIVDLDAHQGNGHERDFMDKIDNVYIMDVYNKCIYPNDVQAKVAIRRNVELHNFVTDDEYLPLIEQNLDKALKEFHPDIVVYNAGTDILAGDPLGKLSISSKGIIQRDEIVFTKVREKNIPIVMLTSGGYLKETARIIADSILNLANLKLLKI